MKTLSTQERRRKGPADVSSIRNESVEMRIAERGLHEDGWVIVVAEHDPASRHAFNSYHPTSIRWVGAASATTETSRSQRNRHAKPVPSGLHDF